MNAPYPARTEREGERLAALDAYGILDTPPERAFDDIVALVGQLLDAPIVAVNLLAEGRQWFKSEIGLGTREMPLDDSICKYALLQQDRMVVPDTTLDARFDCNPLVTGAPGLRFYAGELLTTPGGMVLGTLCVLDLAPRPQGLTQQQATVLATMARQVMSLIELHKAFRDQQLIQEALRRERDHCQRLFEGMGEGYILLDEHFYVRQINTGALHFELRGADEILGRCQWEVWPGSEELEVGRQYKRAMRERIEVNFEQRYVFPDGRRYWIEIRVIPPADGGLAVFYRDITERKEADGALRESQRHALEVAGQAESERRRLDALLEAVPVGIIVADAGGALVHVNAENRKIWGQHPMSSAVDEYVEWKGWWADGSKRHGQPLGKGDWAMAQALAGAPAPRQVIEVESFDRPGERRIVLNSGASIRNEAGDITGAVVAQMDITDRVKAEEALRQADQKKDEFLAMLAHELRNPLAPITAAAAILSHPGLDAATVGRTSAIIARQAKHMTGLIDDLLDVSRVTRGRVDLAASELDMKEIIADAVEQVRPLVEKHQHRLLVQLAPLPAIVQGDRKRLVQVMTNLLSNAAKYTPNGGAIEVLLEADGDEHVITVCDNGIGMTPELMADAFELFSQGKRGLDRSQGGLGIGLALVKSLLQLHGGTVSVHSDGLDLGTRFTVRLPAAARGAADTAGALPAGNDTAPARLRIGIVDDNEDAAAMLSMFLQSFGHEVSIAHSARDAMRALPSFGPDVCLLDIGLPGMDGFELARALRAAPATGAAVLIAITGYAQEKDRQDARDAGFDDLFAKPVDLAALNTLLAQVAQGRLCDASRAVVK
ncbi:ATP-binding protein [Massilia sp. CMS3.1]|uniref:ATP-binding protein n=1 Tax=Massilia sp. CMS3.1 TaxID=3373083 RepID=UPI003EE671C4